MLLNQRPGVAGIGLAVHDARGMGIQDRIVLDVVIVGQSDHGLRAPVSDQMLVELDDLFIAQARPYF